jgi:sulfatase maturation enzyme AslB (radical SAM superfamily)
MSQETLAAFAGWVNDLGDGEGLEITFHGGEPLTAGLAAARQQHRRFILRLY